MFRKVNKQPGMQKFRELIAVTIKIIYDWTLPLNKRAFSAFLLTAVVYGENEYMHESGHLSIFTLLKHLMMLLKYNYFQGFIFKTY